MEGAGPGLLHSQGEAQVGSGLGGRGEREPALALFMFILQFTF